MIFLLIGAAAKRPINNPASTMDSRPWWLKTTYVTQQARALESSSEEGDDEGSNSKH
ncbi:hypothetical protein [Dasania marina]|uniref:hypothetical protein n=1 Tax=Dasania marina TaxID=471499 RepID=UPI0030D91229